MDRIEAICAAQPLIDGALAGAGVTEMLEGPERIDAATGALLNLQLHILNDIDDPEARRVLVRRITFRLMDWSIKWGQTCEAERASEAGRCCAPPCRRRPHAL